MFLTTPTAWSAAGATLSQTAGAKPYALAESYTSFPVYQGGIVSLHYNPASMAFLKQPELSLMTKRGAAEDQFSSFTFGTRVPSSRIPYLAGNAAGTFHYYSAGDIELIDEQGNSKTVSSQKDMALIASYGKMIYRRLGVGVNFKYLRSTLLESFTASTYGADFGALLDLRLVSMGLSFQNMGTSLKYGNTAEPIPFTIRGGISRRFQAYEDHRVITALDFVKKKDESLKFTTGIEYIFQNRIFARFGYRINGTSGKVSMGAGFLIGRLALDSGIQMSGDSGNAYLLSFSFLFGAKD